MAVVVPTAALLIGTALAVPSRSGPGEAPTMPGASQTLCLPTGGIDTVRELDRFARTVRANPIFSGGDVGASVELQDGRHLFVFGDTIRAASYGGQSFVRNSMLVFTPGCAQAILPADRGAIIPDRSDGVGYWPMSVARVERPGYDLVGVTTQRVRDNGDEDAGVFAFDILGPSVALFLVPAGETPQLLGQRDLGADLVDTTRPMWGAAVAVQGDWIYIYGTARPTGATYGGFSLRVARVATDDVLHPTRWRYWDGMSWQADPARAVELVAADGGVSQTLSIFRKQGHWYAVSKRDEVLGTDLALWRAPGPTGPFEVVDVPARIPSDAATGTLRYMPLAHPDLLPRPGSVVVSYSQNNSDFDTVVEDPRLYRPRFLRVRLR